MANGTKLNLKFLFTKKGRLKRSDFWKYMGCTYFLSYIFGYIGVACLAQLNISTKSLDFILSPMLILLTIFWITVNIRRWHDRNKSGWWVLLALIPIIGGILTIIELGFLKGTNGPNRFGDDPLSPGS
ncbi:MAG: DUF805 domain-containing protein [Deltaproteobacteria bacterium]|nr:DUF805 domain-containing protein [Deltaproteobacteria bacterium]